MTKPAVLLTLLCAGCIAATDIDDLLTLTTATTKTTLAVTDTTLIRTTLSNHSDQAVTVQTPSCGPYFFILDSLNHAIIPPQYLCAGITVPKITVAAHDSAVFVDPWAGEGQTKTGGTDRLTPGTYSIYSAMYGTHRLVESEAVHIVVLAP